MFQNTPAQFPIAKLSLYPAWLLEAPSPQAIAHATAQLQKYGAPEKPLLVWRRHEYRHSDQADHLVHYLITGRRFLFAAASLGLTHLPVTFRRARTPEELQPLFLKDCLANDLLSYAGRGEAHARLIALGHHPRQYASKDTGTDPSMVTHLKRIAAFPEPVKWLIRSGALTYNHTKVLHPFAAWPRLLTRLALATVEHDWTAERLSSLTPASFGLAPGLPEPADWPDPGTPPSGDAWRPRRIRQWFVREWTQLVESGLLDPRILAATAARMVAEAGTTAALEIVGHHAPHLEEEAMLLGGQVEEELALRDDGRRDAAARALAIVAVWTRWLHTIATADPMLAWRIGADAYLQWDGPVGATVWLPPRIAPPVPDTAR